MKRQEIMNNMPEDIEGAEKWMGDVLDIMESLLQEITQKLSIDDISELGQIEEARDIAHKAGNDLY